MPWVVIWRHFFDNPDDTDWPLRLPMTKSVVKVMDAVEAYILEKHNVQLEHFCVSGASKRGWTSWTVAAVDYERVKCVMPMLLDCVNTFEVFHNHYKSLGNWTFAMIDYYEQRILVK